MTIFANSAPRTECPHPPRWRCCQGCTRQRQVTLDECRDKMKALKAKSKCLRCGAIGHWAGDPECKFPTSRGGSLKARAAPTSPSLPRHRTPMVACMCPGATTKSHRLAWSMSSAPPALRQHPRLSSAMQMEGGDRRFTHGQHKGQTYEEVSHKVKFVRWALQQPSPTANLMDFLTWFNRYYTINEGPGGHYYRERRASLGIPEGTYDPQPHGKGAKKKTPPNPPTDRCTNCTDFYLPRQFCKLRPQDAFRPFLKRRILGHPRTTV